MRHEILKPVPTRTFVFRGVTFFTRNLEAVDPMTGRLVCFASGNWTHEDAEGVFSDLTAAIADRFNIWETLGLSYAPKFRSGDQIEALQILESEIKQELSKA